MTLLKPTLQVSCLQAFQSGHLAFECAFHPGVNVVRGRNSSGKTTVLDLLAFSLGAENIRWKPEALRCTHTIVEVKLNDGYATLRRSVSDESQRPMEIFWGTLEDAAEAPIQSWERYPFKRSPSLASFSHALFSALEMPIAQGDGASNLTMHQVLRVLYADQPSVHSPIFRIDQWDSALTRETIGGYLAGVYDDDLYSSQLRIREIDILLSRVISELRGILNILGHTGNTPDLDLTNNRIPSLEARREQLSLELSQLKSGELVADKKSHATKLEALRKELSATRRSESDARRTIEALEFEIADSQLFVHEIEERLSGLSDSDVTRQHLAEISFEFCPCCFSPIESSSGSSCQLCKTPSNEDSGRESQLLRMRNELGLQLKESRSLIEKRTTLLQQLQRDLPEKITATRKIQLQLESESSSGASKLEAAIEDIARKLGAIDEEIKQALKLDALSKAVADLQKKRDDFTRERELLADKITILEAKQEGRKKEVSAEIEKAMIRLLRQDLPRQPEFVSAESAVVDFIDNAVFVNGSRNFSESSAVVLRHVFHLALLTASTKLPYMRVPRFVMLDGIDDGGMEKERSHNLQEIIVRECASYEVDYQVIFATSEIKPDFENTEMVVSRFFTPEARSLDVR